MYSRKECHCCSGADISLESALLHCQIDDDQIGGLREDELFPILQFPSADIIGRCFSEKLKEIEKRTEVVEKFAERAIYEIDDYHHKVFSIIRNCLGDFSLIENQIRMITKLVLANLDARGRIIKSDRTEMEFMLALPGRIEEKKAMSTALSRAFSDGFKAYSTDRIDHSFEQILFEVEKSLESKRLVTQRTIYRISLAISYHVSKDIDVKQGSFPSEEIFALSLRRLVARDHVDAVSYTLGKSSLRLWKAVSREDKIARVGEWIACSLRELKLHPNSISMMAELLYTFSSEDRDRITFPNSYILHSLLARDLSCYVDLDISDLLGLAGSLAGKSFSYELGIQNPILERHVKVYTEAVLKDYDKETVAKIASLLMGIVI
jgi:hypothetical protein